ncbi:MAG TPA: hypothetical protein VE990_15310 [Acidimicrobiales bacterium]|nr:hypothetical protein [Acidimicrobiales bacterium]
MDTLSAVVSSTGFLRIVPRPFLEVLASLASCSGGDQAPPGQMLGSRVQIRGLDIAHQEVRGETTMQARVLGVRRSIPMELLICQWTRPRSTRVELNAVRKIRPTQSYYRAGHVLLEAICSEATQEILPTRELDAWRVAVMWATTESLQMS